MLQKCLSWRLISNLVGNLILVSLLDERWDTLKYGFKHTNAALLHKIFNSASPRTITASYNKKMNSLFAMFLLLYFSSFLRCLLYFEEAIPVLKKKRFLFNTSHVMVSLLPKYWNYSSRIVFF